MNQHGSDAPQDDVDQGERQQARSSGSDHAGSNQLPPDRADTERDRADTEGGRAEAEVDRGDKPTAVKLADTDDPSPIRVGSPFAVDPGATLPPRPIERIYDVGPLRYTAMGAVAASVMVLGFAAAGAWWFPAGGALIAALGCVLSIFGLYSTHRLSAAGLLALHLCLFVFSYGRSLG